MDRLSVVISSRDRARELARCLWSLAPERSELHEVIVVDDGSTDDTATVAAAGECTVVRLPRRMGICVARNAGAARATGELLAFIDDDTEVEPGWASGLRRAFGSGAGLIGGRIKAPPPRTLAARYRGLSEPHDMQGRNGFLPFVCGANFAIRTEIFRSLGGFDERLPSSEDLDLSFRVQLAGYRVAFAPEASLVHWPRSSMRAYLRQRAHHVRGDRVVSFKYREFPFQRTKLWRRRAVRALFVQSTGLLMTGSGDDRRRLAYPWITSAAVIAEQLGILKADLELLTGRQPAPEPVPCLDERQRWTATELPPGPSVLFLGDDRLVARLLRITFEAVHDLSVAPGGLAGKALAQWDDPAPPYPELARMARKAGWLAPYAIIIRRLAREQPQTWGEAFCVLHATQASLLRRPRFGLLALGETGRLMARRFPELPIVVLGEDPTPGDRVVFQVTRRGLLGDRKRMVAHLRRVLRQQPSAAAPPQRDTSPSVEPTPFALPETPVSVPATS